MTELEAIQAQRRKLESEYQTKDGLIKSPGKFEGEMIYVPYYWSIGLDGVADRDDGKVYGFDISADERIAFPELGKRRRTINICEDNQGFVREC